MWDLNAAHRKVCKLLTAAIVLGVAAMCPLLASAQSSARPSTQPRAQPRATLIIQSDLGGSVGMRANQIIDIRSNGQRVEIVGHLCLSSCTMYLGAGNVCISPKTVFGFHGPSFFGTPLSKPRFDYWSDVISSFYTRPLRDWYMQTARHTKSGFLKISGAQLIKMGYSQC